jgi:hypothetical protein
MIEIFLNYKFNILLSLIFILLLVLFLFPLEKTLSDILKAPVKKVKVFSILTILALGILFYVSGLHFILSLPMIIFSFFVFLLGFLSNRKYIYLLALISLSLTPVMLILKMEQIAEFFAQTCYLLLVLGVLKDVFYEKIFE